MNTFGEVIIKGGDGEIEFYFPELNLYVEVDDVSPKWFAAQFSKGKQRIAIMPIQSTNPDNKYQVAGESVTVPPAAADSNL